jgi:ribosomal protein S7
MKFKSVVEHFINNLYRSGKKGRGRKVLYDIMEVLNIERSRNMVKFGESRKEILKILRALKNEAFLDNPHLDIEEEEFLADAARYRKKLAIEKKVPLVKLDNIIMLQAPIVRVKPRRSGAKTYAVAKYLNMNKRRNFVYRSMFSTCNGKMRGTLTEKIIKEFEKMRRGEGEALRRRKEIIDKLEDDLPFVYSMKRTLPKKK